MVIMLIDWSVQSVNHFNYSVKKFVLHIATIHEKQLAITVIASYLNLNMLSRLPSFLH